MRYWEVPGDPERRRFCFTTEPLMVCPLADPDPERPPGDVGSPWPPGIEASADALGIPPGDLAAILRERHRRASGRRRIDGKLTRECAACGHKLIDCGYSAYVERDKREDEYASEDRSSAAIASRLGFSVPTVRLKGMNGLKRSEARQWAWEERQLARAALEEEGSVR